MTEPAIQSVQGTEDILPGQWGWWRRLCEEARRLFELYGYGEVRTPIFEHLALFVKGTGETTDIVQKQMYLIESGGGDGMALRPEGTPPVIRAYLEHNFHKSRRFQKFYYVGPMFRKERPQKGRLRQFHQAGVEAIGGASPLLDAETIMLAVDIYRAVGLKRFVVKLNSIGCADCRPTYRQEVRGLLEAHRGDLCEDCQLRLDRNVFRILDCKNEQCRQLTAELPTMADSLCAQCKEHYLEVKRALDESGVAYVEDPHLVRGLDYYTRTVYEITHEGLGARDTICGGGRYDGLVELLGGPPTPCVGFAMGVEASILAAEAELGAAPSTELRPAIYVVCFQQEARTVSFGLLRSLREAGIAAEMDFEDRSAKAQMRAANSLGCPLCFLVGQREVEQGRVSIKDMQGGEQWTVAFAEAVAEVRRFMEKARRNTG